MTPPKVSRNGSSQRHRQHRAPLYLGQGRLKERVPVAVIDIGSNSVRQVIYEGLTRAPAVLFNEKVLCGLGAGMAATGRLNDMAVERALHAIRRFVALQHQAHVGHMHIIATAAAREASNGPDFIARVEEITETPVEVLTGQREAHYSALGIISGFHHPDGIVGDMGGGSLELIGTGDEEESGITTPLGGLRLQELSGGSIREARAIAREILGQVQIGWPGKGKTFYAVGGTWRSLGKLHIANHHYPLAAIHDYEVSAERMKGFCDKVAEGGLSDIKGIDAVSKNRRDLLPFGAVVLREIIRKLRPQNVTISSLGVREGLLYSKLGRKERDKDALIVSARDLSILRARSPEHSQELADWTSAAFRTLGMNESLDESRYRIASCYLADIGWRAHPDFRAQQALEVIANAGFTSIDHEGRAYLAIANFHRYQGLGSKTEPPRTAVLAGPEVRRKARALAALFRVLYLFSASMPGVIPRIGLERRGENEAVFILPADLADLEGERPGERIEQLGREIGMQMSLEVAQD